jgi:hypothetical protein
VGVVVGATVLEQCGDDAGCGVGDGGGDGGVVHRGAVEDVDLECAVDPGADVGGGLVEKLAGAGQFGDEGRVFGWRLFGGELV